MCRAVTALSVCPGGGLVLAAVGVRSASAPEGCWSCSVSRLHGFANLAPYHGHSPEDIPGSRLAPYHGHGPEDIPGSRGEHKFTERDVSGEEKRECLAKHFSLRLGSAL